MQNRLLHQDHIYRQVPWDTIILNFSKSFEKAGSIEIDL